jgi:predicted exporter
MQLFKVTREPDRTIEDAKGVRLSVPGAITDVRGSPLAVFGLPVLLVLLGLGANYALEWAKYDNAVQLACVSRAVTAGTSGLPGFCRLPR